MNMYWPNLARMSAKHQSSLAPSCQRSLQKTLVCPSLGWGCSGFHFSNVQHKRSSPACRMGLTTLRGYSLSKQGLSTCLLK